MQRSQPSRCLCCGSQPMEAQPILWKRLIDEWRLAPFEVEYVNRQQGLRCMACGANLRSMALAGAIMRGYGHEGFLEQFVRSDVSRKLRILEINEAGSLTPLLAKMPGHTFKAYPDIDMMNIAFGEASFDLVVHSDTLEHVKYPVKALAECCRVLVPGGFCAFTVPMIVDRLTSSREGCPPSYHNNEQERGDDLVVCTEYGADAWKHVILAGFRECRIFSLEFPAAQALVGVKS